MLASSGRSLGFWTCRNKEDVGGRRIRCHHRRQFQGYHAFNKSICRAASGERKGGGRGGGLSDKVTTQAAGFSASDSLRFASAQTRESQAMWILALCAPVCVCLCPGKCFGHEDKRHGGSLRNEWAGMNVWPCVRVCVCDIHSCRKSHKSSGGTLTCACFESERVNKMSVLCWENPRQRLLPEERKVSRKICNYCLRTFCISLSLSLPSCLPLTLFKLYLSLQPGQSSLLSCYLFKKIFPKLHTESSQAKTCAISCVAICLCATSYVALHSFDTAEPQTESCIRTPSYESSFWMRTFSFNTCFWRYRKLMMWRKCKKGWGGGRLRKGIFFTRGSMKVWSVWSWIS